MWMKVTALAVALSFAAAGTVSAKDKDTKKKPAPAAAVVAPSPAPPKEPEPPKEDPGRNQMFGGIVTSTTGAALAGAGIAILAGSAATDDVSTDRALFLSGGIALGVGATAALVGVLVWATGRKESNDWKASRRALALQIKF
jgi:hypothetical protein